MLGQIHKNLKILSSGSSYSRGSLHHLVEFVEINRAVPVQVCLLNQPIQCVIVHFVFSLYVNSSLLEKSSFKSCLEILPSWSVSRISKASFTISVLRTSSKSRFPAQYSVNVTFPEVDESREETILLTRSAAGLSFCLCRAVLNSSANNVPVLL